MADLPDILENLRTALACTPQPNEYRHLQDQLLTVIDHGPSAYRDAASHLLDSWQQIDQSTSNEHDHSYYTAQLALATDEACKLAGLLPPPSEPKRVKSAPPVQAKSLLQKSFALRYSRPVCRILRADVRLFVGTGFMVAPGYVITNYHVIKNAEQAQVSCAEFRSVINAPGQPDPPDAIVRYSLGTPIYASQPLDCAIIPCPPSRGSPSSVPGASCPVRPYSVPCLANP